MASKPVLVRIDQIDGVPTEYFCTKCLQLRLSFFPILISCRNCHSIDIITGKVGTLDKQALLKKYKT